MSPNTTMVGIFAMLIREKSDRSKLRFYCSVLEGASRFPRLTTYRATHIHISAKRSHPISVKANRLLNHPRLVPPEHVYEQGTEDMTKCVDLKKSDLQTQDETADDLHD